jgi:tetratricopeptide (TPR) repeat protein
MINWQDVWKRLSEGQHVVTCGAGPMPQPDRAELRLSWVDCEAHPEPCGTLEEARRRIDRDLGVRPWVDLAAQRLRSGLRRHLLGEDADDIDMARYEHTFRRAVPDASGPRAALLLSGVDRADRASIEWLTRLFSGEHRPSWPLLIRFDASEPSGAARRLFDALERVLPPEAILREASAGSSGKDEATPARLLVQLSHETLRVLRAAATIGDRFELETVAQLLDLDDLAVLDAVQEARDRGLGLEDRSRGVFRFDPRTAAALRATTLPPLADAWHRRLAELFGGLPAPSSRSEPPPASAPREPTPPPSAPPRAGGEASTPTATEAAASEAPTTLRSADQCLAVDPGVSPGPDDPRPPAWWQRLEAEAREPRGARPVSAADGLLRPALAGPDEGCADDWRSALHAEAAGLPDQAAARFLAAASAAALAGRHEQALASAGRALALAEGLPEQERRLLGARALLVMGRCRWQARSAEPGSLDLALEALEQGRERLATGRHSELQAELATMIANVCYDVGTPQALERALVEITRASQLWLDAGQPLEAARLLNDEAAIWVKRGNPVRANQLLVRSREVFGKMPPSHPAARLELLETEHLLARLMLHAALVPGREHEALQLGVRHALVAENGYRGLDDRRQLGRVWETLGRLELRLGQLDAASDHLERAHCLQREIGDAMGAARSAGALSEVFAAAHDYPRALSSLAESIAFNGEKGSAAGLQYNLASLGQLEAQLPAALIDQARALGQRLVRALSVS